MKKLFLTFAIAGLVFGFTSCAKKGGETAKDSTTQTDADSTPEDGATDMDEKNTDSEAPTPTPHVCNEKCDKDAGTCFKKCGEEGHECKEACKKKDEEKHEGHHGGDDHHVHEDGTVHKGSH